MILILNNDIEFNLIGNKNSKHNNLASSSIFKPDHLIKKHPNLQVNETILIKTISFPDFIKKYNINLNDKYDLVLDTQGNELRILKGIGDHLKNVNILETEFTDDKLNYYEGGCKFSELNEFLNNNNFSLISKDNKLHGNAVYKKNLN